MEKESNEFLASQKYLGTFQTRWFYTILIMKFSPGQVKLFNFQEDSKNCFIDIMTFATGNYFLIAKKECQTPLSQRVLLTDVIYVKDILLLGW